MGTSAVGAFGYYVIVISGMLFVQTLALYPIAALVGRVPAKRFAEAAFPAQAIALSSRSSLVSPRQRRLIIAAVNALLLDQPAAVEFHAEVVIEAHGV